jgi:aminopeptidase N
VPLEIFDRHLYEKGGRVLHMLRALLGERPFFNTLAHYVDKHRDRSVHTRDLIVAIEETTGRSLDWFFEQWVTDGAGHPELSVHFAWDAGLGMAIVTVDQEQEVDRDTPLFRLPVTLRFRLGEAADDHDVDIEITEKHQIFHIALSNAPTQAIFDPGKVLLAKVKTKKSGELWRTEVAHATLAIDRAHAADELGEIGDRRATKALIAALEHDPFWSVRAHAAAALGENSSERARDALIAAVSGTWHAKARRAVVAALGAWRDDDRVTDTLIEIIQNGDASYFVEAEACLSLGKTRSKRAPEVLRRAAKRDSFMDIIRQKAYQGLAEARDDSAATLLAEATRYGGHPYGRRAAIMALARLSSGRRDRDARDVRELAERLLFDKGYRVQYGAIEALAVCADAAAIPALEKLIARTLDGRLRRRAREVVRDLRSGESTRARIEAMEGELERVRKSANEVRERLERFEAAVAGESSQQGQSDKKRKKHKKHKKEGRESGDVGHD